MQSTAKHPKWLVECATGSSPSSSVRRRRLQHHRLLHLNAAASIALCLTLTCVYYWAPELALLWRRSLPIANLPLSHALNAKAQPPLTHLVFCSRELEQLTVGGAGVVVADMVRALTLSGQWRVTVLLDLPPSAPLSSHQQRRRRLQAWRTVAAEAWAGGVNAWAQHSVLTNLRILLLDDLLGPQYKQNDRLPLFWRNSMRWNHGLQALYAKDPFEAVEFFDYEAPAYHTLLWRLKKVSGDKDADNAIVRTYAFQVWIRTHGLLQSIDSVENQQQQQQGQRYDQTPLIDSLKYVYHMETRALQLADAVIANSRSIGDEYAVKHRLDTSAAAHRIIAIPPTLGTLEFYDAPSLRSDGAPVDRAKTNILVYGKLQRVKGADMAARAIVQVMRKLRSQWQGRAIFAGDDMPCVSDPTVNMSTCIQQLIIPSDLQGRFRFIGTIKRGEIAEIAAANDVRLAILPSRYETFCLAAHEVKHYGIPLLLPELPAYRDFFVDGLNALMFEAGSTSDLARVLTRALRDDDVVERTRRGPQFDYGDPVEGYRGLLVGPLANGSRVETN